MATYENKDIELIVHIRGGKFYKLSSVLSSVVWSGDIKSPSRTLEFSFLQAVNDAKVQQLGIVEGSTCCFYVGGKEIFRGTIIDIDKSNSNNEISMTAHDIGFLLAKDQVNYNFVNKTACDIAKEVFKGKDKQPPLKWGKIAPAGTKITKMFIGATRYDTIMSVYTAHSKADKDHKKYMVEVDLDKFNIIEKGVTKLKIMFEEGQNLEMATYKVSMDNIVSRVVVVDEKGNKVKESLNAELRKLYQYISKVIEQKKDKAITDEEIKAEFKKPERSCSLSGYGDISCKCGYKVQVKDSFTGLIGEFYIDKDKHTWSGGKYTVDLELNFDNIMDEKNAGKDETKESSSDGAGGSSTKDWGHGVTAEMLNKVLKGPLAGKGDLFVKYGNMYKVNPMLLLMIARMETGAGFDSNLARNCNNFFGIRDPDPNIRKTSGGFGIYSSIEEGIKRGFHFIGISHIHKKNRSYDQIISTWAPKSDGNNVAAYIANTKKWYKEWTGTDWNDSKRGSGVASDAEAEANVVATSSGTSSSGLTGVVNVATKYLRNGVNKPGFAWCCWFATKCLREAGYTPVANTNLCDAYYTAYKNVGRLKTPNEYIPKPGDTIFFYGNGGYSRRYTNHVGIVTGVSGSGESMKVHTIEGNSGNKVAARTYGKYRSSWARIVGYGVN
ncbi:XkdQ/YqbQ family protein [Peptostreptococcus sp.]|uniref:XkdQ/YqbQ family protein n=1 Tax=Peptostreptococcus sp. TaxID=1262 RepID=UPI001E00BC7A|nr:glucosaminidase domain-containing protein [Peptostreptococcus sp.]MBS5595661.1 glucosaminidase domain-containing protein [Peptostreptococcus sp.]